MHLEWVELFQANVSSAERSRFEHMQMKQRRVVAWLTLAVFCLILLPFMKHSWLDRNQANPNYYFAYSGLHSCLGSWLYSGERNDPKYRPRVLFFSVSFDFFLFLLGS